MARVPRLGRTIAVLGGVAVASLTLFPNPAGVAAAAATPLLCLVCGDHGGVDVVLNLLLFMPLGLGIGLASGSWRRAVGVAAAASLLVELLQLTLVIGRDASLSDLITNTAGGAIGGLIAVRAGLLAAPTRRAAWRLLLAGATGWLALLGLSAWLQTPRVGGGAVASTWAHPAAPDAFQGRVLSVVANGEPMPVNAPVPDGEAARQALRAGRLSLDVRLESGPHSAQRRWIYVMSQGGRPRLSLSQQRRTAVLALPSRSLRFRLNPPTLLLPGAFPREPGAPVVLRAGTRGRGLWLDSAHDGVVRRYGLGLSPAHGWALIAPFGLGLGPGTRIVTGLLLCGLALPLGYWSRAAGSGGAPAAVGLALGLGLLAIPAAAGFDPVHWSEWLGAVAGASAGWALHLGAAYLQPRCGSPSTSESSSS